LSVSTKQMPRHWVLGPVSGSRVGSQGSPSARRAVEAAVPHSPVRVLHAIPAGQWSLLEQKYSQPVRSGSPLSCVYHQPVHTVPARHVPGIPARAVGVHCGAQKVTASAPSPSARQVEPRPPHWAISQSCEALLEHSAEQ